MTSRKRHVTVLRRGSQRNTRNRLWTSMRVMRTFSLQDLVVTGPAGYSTVKMFVRGLLRAGYVRIVQEKGNAAGQAAVYRLARDTGPVAPLIDKAGILTDPNLRKESES